MSFKDPRQLAGELVDVVDDVPVFNQAEQDERKKANKRYISKNTFTNGKFNWVVSGDPYSKYPWQQNKGFNDYPSAHKYLSEIEKAEEDRRNKLLNDYYGGQGDLEQLHTNILDEFGGNIKAAFEWLLRNGRR